MSSEPYYVNPGDRITAGWANSVVSAVKRRKYVSRRKLQFAGDQGEDCPFGEIITDTSVSPSKQVVRGGVVFAGNKNFNMDGYDIQLTNNRKAFIYIEIGVTVNMDDDNEILLPNIDTATTPVFKENTTNYPDNTNPTVPGGTGTLILPVAYLEIESNNVKIFEPTGCGNFQCNHCAGTLFFNRI